MLRACPVVLRVGLLVGSRLVCSLGGLYSFRVLVVAYTGLRSSAYLYPTGVFCDSTSAFLVNEYQVDLLAHVATQPTATTWYS